LKKELTENPEFFKAFPHLQIMFNTKKDTDEIDENAPYHHDKVLGFKEPGKEEPYFETLL
jgi:hypothetical protein